MPRTLPPDAVGFKLSRTSRPASEEPSVAFPTGWPGAVRALRLYQEFGWVKDAGRNCEGFLHILNADGETLESLLIPTGVDYARLARDLLLVAEPDPPPLKLSPAQQILLRDLGGELIRYRERERVRITETTYRALIRFGLIERGFFQGSNTGGTRVTPAGRHQAFQLTLQALDEASATG